MQKGEPPRADQADVADGNEAVPSPPGIETVLSADTAAHIADILRAMSDPTRLRLLSALLGSASGEACAQDLARPLELSQPTVSHHLKTLTEAGLLVREKRGKHSWYAIRSDRVEVVRSLLG